MDIYKKLPLEIQRKIFYHFQHPISKTIKREVRWFWNKHRNTPPICFDERLYWAKLANRTCYRHACGCTFREEHQVCCDYVKEENLEHWDIAVQSTPLLQALEKAHMHDELMQHQNFRV